MKRYKVVRRAFTRVKEVYYVKAGNPESAIEIAKDSKFDECLEDMFYYEPYGDFEVVEVE